jgi:hypothetical protein
MAQWSIQPETRRLIFLNETSVKTNMARSHGRAPIAECLVAPVPHGHRHTPSFIGWLSDDGMVAPYVLEGAVNQFAIPPSSSVVTNMTLLTDPRFRGLP